MSKTRGSDTFFLPNISTLNDAMRSAEFVDRWGRDRNRDGDRDRDRDRDRDAISS